MKSRASSVDISVKLGPSNSNVFTSVPFNVHTSR
jgi:hypothetical protein